MRILDRYLTRHFLGALVYCLLLFMILFIVIDWFNNLDEFLKNSVAPSVILSYYLYSLPAIFVQLIPVAALVSLLYTLANLNKHHEIVSIKASGVSISQALLPCLFAGAVLSFVVLLLNETIVPESVVASTSIKEGLIEKNSQSATGRAIKNITVYGKNNFMLYAREYELVRQTLHDVVLLENAPNQALKSKMTAKKAEYLGEHRWVFYDAMRYQLSRRGEMIGEPDFMPKFEMELDEHPEDFIRDTSQTEFMNTRKLREYIDRLKGSGEKSMRRLLVDLYHKMALPFAPFILILLGAPLAMRNPRGGIMVGVGTSFAIVFLYYGILSLSLALGKGGILLPFVAAWLPNLLFGITGIYLIKKSA
jgi:lipopolysaccharide export system permease protein